ncbi:MAG: type II toxin-antitoxin system RelE/ParE family toxin [Phormidium sp.]
MTAQFRLTKPAIQDIEQIADYIARQSGLDRADRFLNKLDAKFNPNRMVRLDRRTNKIYILAGDETEIEIDSNGNWEYL